MHDYLAYSSKLVLKQACVHEVLLHRFESQVSNHIAIIIQILTSVQVVATVAPKFAPIPLVHTHVTV